MLEVFNSTYGPLLYYVVMEHRSNYKKIPKLNIIKCAISLDWVTINFTNCSNKRNINLLPLKLKLSIESYLIPHIIKNKISLIISS